MGFIIIKISNFDMIQFLIIILEPQRVLDLAQYPIPSLPGGIGRFGVIRFFPVFLGAIHILMKEASRRNDGTIVEGKDSRKFWRRMYLQPDIIIRKGNQTIIVDTKWKLPNQGIPGEQDIRQVFAYGLYLSAQRVILLYPGNGTHTPIEAPFETVAGHSSIVLSCSMDYANLVTETGRLNKEFTKQFLAQLS